ncbi:MFS transporter [Pseudoroseomonas cervicalis]|uniref:MFS transporter n=1 Tax=Teichococcus cervicalis TaxID=204525 RepID=UPI0027819E17|nr:MFS transporter [Pseudoroseomonas cervicalis]MDQ1081699.1 MFS family permease [Pseudoroseomonas cervicalis]
MNRVDLLDSRTAWLRLGVVVALATLGGVGMWSVVVTLPSLQTEFGITRGDASMVYTLAMLGFGAGGVLMGRLIDRHGPMRPLLAATAMLGGGYILAGLAPGPVVFTLAQALLIGMLGSAAAFTPLVAEVSLWFRKRRGVAVAIAASGNYLAGAIWPPVLSWLIGAYGWRTAHVIVGLVCLVTMAPLALLLRARAPEIPAGAGAGEGGEGRSFGLSRNALTVLLCAAGVACCVAMAMPQVHIVAYCGDLGYGVARGAEMLSLMLACGIVSRLASGVIADRIGGLRTLLLGSVLQGLALSLFLFFDGLASLYVLSALFGLVQGGIVPSYAVIVRESFPASEAGTRVGIVLMATLVGMALGGWLSGVIFDLTGSYAAAFLNGMLWNLANVLIMVSLLARRRARLATV